MKTMQSNLFYCKITLHVSGVTAPIIRSDETVTAASGTGHNIGPAVFSTPDDGPGRDRVPTWPRWKEVAGPIL